MASIDRYYFNVCTDGARRAGVDIDRLLIHAGIEPTRLAEPGWRGDVSAMARLVREIWAVLDDEFMGYTARPMPRGALAFATEVAAAGGTVAEGVARAIRFYNLAGPDISTEYRETDGRATIRVRFAEPERDPTHYFSEFWLIIWHRLACWLAGEVVPMLEAHFDYPRPDTYFEEFKYLFPCAHRFDAGERLIVLDAGALQVPVRRTRAEIEAMTGDAPLGLMTIPASDTTLARRLRLLLSHDPSLSLKAIADDLGLAADTLRRKLRAEAATISQLRENVRRDAAIRDLTTTGRSIEAIAARLGYAEPRSFTRAFRAWTGTSPKIYRIRHAHRR